MESRMTLGVLPRTQRGQPLVLSCSPDGQTLVYCHGHSVVLRSLADPSKADVYTQHACDVLVAKYSPSGFYVASADKSGKVRIWDTVNQEHILKNEFQPISGPIRDLAWSADSQRIVVVGEGREKFGHVFLADTGTSNGDITGQSRPVNSCDFRPARPFRIVTGSEDNTAAVYEGPPFRFKGTKTEHSRYCQAVRFSPNGAFWASAGFDGKLFLYEGKDSTLLGEFTPGEPGKSAHDGGIYGLAWSPDSKRLLSASGDKTCKIWLADDTRQLVGTFRLGDTVSDQQLSCLWPSDNRCVSVSLSGAINFLDPREVESGKPEHVIQGHNKPITALVKSTDEPDVFFTGDSEGRITRWDCARGAGVWLKGQRPEAQINSLAWGGGSDGGLAVGVDDTLRPLEADAFSASGAAFKFKSQPRQVARAAVGCTPTTFVATHKSVLVMQGGEVAFELACDGYEPSCLAVSAEKRHVAVGEAGGQVLRIYRLEHGQTLEEAKTLKLTGSVTAVAYSPDQAYLAVADSNRRVTLYKCGQGDDYERAFEREWGFHTAKVTCLAWAPGGRFLASGGLDCAVILWSVDAPNKHHILSSAHVQSQITAVAWMDDATLLSTGQDGNVKVWDVTWKPE